MAAAAANQFIVRVRGPTAMWRVGGLSPASTVGALKKSYGRVRGHLDSQIMRILQSKIDESEDWVKLFKQSLEHITQIETNFAVADGMVDVWEVLPGAGGSDEWHPLVMVPVPGRYGHDMRWDLADESEWVPGTETRFRCGVHDDSLDTMVYIARAYNEAAELADCAAWGGRVDDVLANPEGGGDVTNHNGVVRAHEISPETCTVF